MIKKLHHVSVAVRNLDETIRLYNKLLGGKPLNVYETPGKTRIAQYQVGEIQLEFMEPGLGSSVTKFIDEKGEGLHHIAFEVDDLPEELNKQAGLGISLIDKTPRRSPMGEIAFTGPEGSAGVTIELIQPAKTGGKK